LKVYNRKLGHDDCLLVPELFGPEDDFSIYDKICLDLTPPVHLQKLNNNNVAAGSAEWTTCRSSPADGGEHHWTCAKPGRSPAFRDIIAKMAKYFGIRKDETLKFKLDWYPDDYSDSTGPPGQFPEYVKNNGLAGLHQSMVFV
jgi:hypothetical protein